MLLRGCLGVYEGRSPPRAPSSPGPPKRTPVFSACRATAASRTLHAPRAPSDELGAQLSDARGNPFLGTKEVVFCDSGEIGRWQPGPHGKEGVDGSSPPEGFRNDDFERLLTLLGEERIQLLGSVTGCCMSG